MDIPYEKIIAKVNHDMEQERSGKKQAIRKKVAHFHKIAERARTENGCLVAAIVGGLFPYETTMTGQVLTLDEEYVGIEHKGSELCIPINYVSTLFIREK